MFVKICGLTNQDDAFAAVEMGAQAIGFVLYSKSPRYVEPEALRPWVSQIPKHVWKVGVFVDENPARVHAICKALGLDVAQLHGAETPADHPAGVRVWKAFRISGNNAPQLDYPADAVLFDGPGGGRAFDWSMCSGVSRPLILAGGLNEDNVAAAVSQVHPWGVDVSSGIEIAPGKKDHARMKNFIKAALQ